MIREKTLYILLAIVVNVVLALASHVAATYNFCHLVNSWPSIIILTLC